MNLNKEKNRHPRIFSYIFLITILLSTITQPAESKTERTLPYPLLQRGMCYAIWDKDGFLSPGSDKSLEAMADSGVTCVAIVVTWYQKKVNSIVMEPTDKTPQDKALQHAIKKAHKCGMAVMLKPHVDLEDQSYSQWRADIGFQSEEDWKKWFFNYSNFINHYTKLAEKEKVEFFCIGTELSFAASKTTFWRDLIVPSVRKNFSGQITYAANWDEYNNIMFWDLLDYASIDAYFPLVNKYDPSYDEIIAGWQKWLNDIETWQQGINKPVLFTECGYSSADIAALKPWEVAMSGNPNLRLQLDCYKAVFETFWNKEWFWGIYWWSWSTSVNAGGPNNRRFTPQNKPALLEMKKWYVKIADKEKAIARAQAAKVQASLFEKEFIPLEGITPLNLEESATPNIPELSHLAVEPFSERIKKGLIGRAKIKQK